MNKKQVIVLIAIGAIFMSGCVSVDGTRAQLASKNASEVEKGEETIYTIATTGRDSSGFVQFKTSEQVEYVKLSSNQDLLLRIIDDAPSGEVVAAAVKKLDFTSKGAARSFVQDHFGRLDSTSEKERQSLKVKIVSHLSQDELLELIGDRGANEARFRDRMRNARGSRIPGLSFADRNMLVDRLVEITDSPEILWRMKTGDIPADQYRHLPKVEEKLLTVLDKVSNPELAEKLLGAKKSRDNYLLVESSEQRFLLLRKLSEEKMAQQAFDGIKEEVSKYNFNGRHWDFKTALLVASVVKDSGTKVRLVATILSRQYDIKKECKESFMYNWGEADETSLLQVVKGIPALTTEETAEVLTSRGNGWHLIIDTISPKMAKNVLASGKVASDDLEKALVGRIPPEKLDMKVYRSVKSAQTKKSVLDAMPTAQKELAAKEQAKAIDKILADAKVAGKETLVFKGFYLGMPFADAKAMFVHHFPELEFTEGIDGSGDKADHCIYAPGQSNPFCFASVKDGKVWQFNFGKKLLKKWFKYDASTTRDWAKTFGREKGLEMKLDFIDRTGEVYTMNGMLQAEPHPASLHQEIWTYKSGTKNYRLTYFGKPDFGGYGAAIRELAREKWRYVTADEGTLRAVIDND